MILMTMIARVSDGLPLAASMQEDEQTGRSMVEYQSKAKQLFRKLSNESPVRCTLEADPYLFHYSMERGAVFLVLTPCEFSKKQAFAYLEELQNEFISCYGPKIDSVTRPYGFIEFDTFIQKTKKTYSDTRVRHKLNNLNSELRDVTKIMVQNIDDVLARGEKLTALDDKARDLSAVSKKYRKDARYLNTRSGYVKVLAALIIVILFMLLARYLFF